MLSVDAPWKLFAFAGVSSCCGELVANPFDTIKTRLQVQGQRVPLVGTPLATFHYKGTLHGLTTMALHEGLPSLYSGLPPALLRQASYGSLRLGLYDPCKRAMEGVLGHTTPVILLRGASGALCGALASFAATPTDLLKVRMQVGVGTGRKEAPGLVGAAAAIVREGGGVFALWRGWAPTAQRAAVVAAAEIGGYETVKEYLGTLGLAPTATSTHLLSSITAGLFASLLSSPLDVIKSRVMDGGIQYGGSLQCALHTVRSEGVLALWSGVQSDFARRAPHTVTTYLVLEALRARWGGGGG